MENLITRFINSKSADRDNKIIAVEQLIKDARKKGVDFGKGDPYNRLRYYTKIGWLPHMTRKKGEKGSTRGHYPEWVLTRLEQIEKFKNQKLSNEEITKRLGAEDNLKNVTSFISTPEARIKLVTYTSFLILVLIFASELDLLPVGKSKRQLIDQNAQSFPKQILDSGKGFIIANKQAVFVQSTHVNPNSKIYVSFNHNYSPAVRYWVGQIELFEGFYVELDTPTAQSAEFSWWITD